LLAAKHEINAANVPREGAPLLLHLFDDAAIPWVLECDRVDQQNFAPCCDLGMTPVRMNPFGRVPADAAPGVLAAPERGGASGRHVLDGEIEAFDRAFAQCCGGPSAVGIAWGLNAIALSLRARGIEHGRTRDQQPGRS
jgi:hypothetical protein